MNAVLALLLAFCVAANAQSPIMGLDAGIARGYDVVNEKIRAPVFASYTYEMYNQTWTSPFDGHTYAIPDQLYVTDIDQSVVDEDIEEYDTWTSYYETKTSSMGVDISLGFGDGLSINGGFQQTKAEMKGLFSNNSRNVAISNRIISFYQLDVFPGSSLSKPFQMMAQNLPNGIKNDNDKQKYRNFIQAFGTHYISSAQFGAKINITTTYDSSLLNTYSRSWVENNIKLSINFEKYSLGFDSNSNDSTNNASQVFKNQSKTFSEHVGGDPIIFETKGYDTWLPTVVANPGLVLDRVILETIDTLIPDQTKSAALRSVLIEYCTNGSI